MKCERKPLGIARCGVLDQDGRRCRRTSVTGVEYHGNPELYDYFNKRPTWAVILVCRKHADEVQA